MFKLQCVQCQNHLQDDDTTLRVKRGRFGGRAEPDEGQRHSRGKSKGLECRTIKEKLQLTEENPDAN